MQLKFICNKTLYITEEWHGSHPQKKLLKPSHKKARLESGPMPTKMNATGTLYCGVMRPKSIFLESMASKLSGIKSVRNTKKKCMVPTVKHGGGSALMTGCMSAAWCWGAGFL